MRVEKRMLKKLWLAVVIIGAALAGGCAGNSAIPAGKIAAVERSIQDAKVNTATLDAPAELKNAEDGLAAAKAAMADGQYEDASRLADRASADAEYARTKAASAKSRKMADEAREAVRSLQQEIERMPAK